MCGYTALHIRNTPSMLTDMTRRHSAKSSSSQGTNGTIAASLTRMSILPNRSTAAATRALTWSGSLTSVTCAVPPISAAVLAAVSSFLSATITLAPSARSFSAMARPMP